MFKRFGPLYPACVLLSACGGGGGGSVASTGTPATAPAAPAEATPGTGTNSALTGTLASETFANKAVTGSASYSKTAGLSSQSTASATLSIAYFAGTNSYAVSSGGVSQTFAQADRDALSNAQVTVYKKVAGNVTDTLSLTNPGTSGALTYKYVGSGFWQRTTDSASNTSATVNGFTYGAVTPDAAVPRSGNASYSFDLLGTHVYDDSPVSLGGTGTMLAQFGPNTLAFSGTYKEVRPDGTVVVPNGLPLSGSGTIASAGNGFTGTLKLFTLTETLDGRFYGPAADEFGASFYGDGSVGTLIGRRDATLASSGGTTSFTVKSASRRATYDSSGKTAPLAGDNVWDVKTFAVDTAAGQRTVTDLLGGSAIFPDSSKVASESDANITTYRVTNGTQTDSLTLFNQGSSNTQLALTYSSFGYWRQAKPSADPTRTDVSERMFTYGVRSASDFVPKSGTASYAGVIFGHGAATSVGGPQYQLGGTGHVDFDFGTQKFSASLDPTLTNTATTVTSPWFRMTVSAGSITFANVGTVGTNVPAAAIFSGQLVASNVVAGTLDGNFYGPNLEEIGAVFRANSTFAGSGVEVVGAFAGKKQ